MREAITTTKRWVIHVESRLIAAAGGLNIDAIHRLAAEVATLHQQGIEVVMVSAGATAACASPANGDIVPLHEAQALAAIGQIKLTNAWAQGLAAYGLQSAQILLTQDDLSHRKHYLNARSTLQVLLGKDVVSVVSENGTVASHGIRAGDTGSLGALVVNLVQADVYVLLTEVKGLVMPDSILDLDQADAFIDQAPAADSALDRCAHEMTERFGFDVRSWLRSARLAARSGAHTVIADGREAGVLGAIASGASLGTLLTSDTHPTASRDRWLANQLPMRGVLEIITGSNDGVPDASGITALMILRVEGVFQRGDMVVCRGADGAELTRGLVNYSSQEIQKLRGQFVEAFPRQIGYVAEPDIISHENRVTCPVL
ncbi:MAG: glutamate 5-kinase [Pseudomonas sp.]|uniref:glutamate 5-kinase n=1 Tax=Pseudomonas sp. TaxID=306 RepID=UPI0023932594|nr:glutamate 5-kinase [Pseudomonas sp.]MDE1194862.1 glutamate 5-kinase [Pseudomonas sp.]